LLLGLGIDAFHADSLGRLALAGRRQSGQLTFQALGLVSVGLQNVANFARIGLQVIEL